MQVIHDFTTAKIGPSLALTIGSFDGVHRGHLRILAELRRIAQINKGAAAVMTLNPHPRELFAAPKTPNLLTTQNKKLELLEHAGAEIVFILPFNKTIAQMKPQAFVREIIAGACHARQLVIGHDFRFGRNALGDYDLLTTLGKKLGFHVTQVPPFIIAGERVSSTAIREHLLEGDLETAETLLGRKYSLRGEVIAGHGLGATLGFPTANIRPYHSAIPAQGVYAAKILLENHLYNGAVNIGIAPTLKNEDTLIEAFLLDFHQDIRGRTIEITFHKRLRPEKKFDAREQLTEAIRHDVQKIRAYFAKTNGHHGKPPPPPRNGNFP